MDAFWMGETLKYFYLIFSEPELVSLDEFVLSGFLNREQRAQSGAVQVFRRPLDNIYGRGGDQSTGRKYCI